MNSPLPSGVPKLGTYVRVHLNHGGGVLAEGDVIGVYEHPTYIVRTVDGRQVACSSTLRHELIPAREPQTGHGHCPVCRGEVAAVFTDFLRESYESMVERRPEWLGPKPTHTKDSGGAP